MGKVLGNGRLTIAAPDAARTAVSSSVSVNPKAPSQPRRAGEHGVERSARRRGK